MYCERGPSATWTRRPLPPGDAGVALSVSTMKRLIDEPSPILAETAAALTWGSGGDPEEAARAIAEFVAARVLYVQDAWNGEVLRSPTYMLRRIERDGAAFGDCDDMATLAAALGRAAGFPARLILVGFGAAEPYSHVYAELQTPAGWVTIDPVAPPEGAPVPVRRKVVPL